MGERRRKKEKKLEKKKSKKNRINSSDAVQSKEVFMDTQCVYKYRAKSDKRKITAKKYAFLGKQ